MNMEFKRDPNFEHDMRLQKKLANLVFHMQHPDIEEKDIKRSEPGVEWTTGDEATHVPAHFYHEVLRDEGLLPQEVSLEDEKTLDTLAHKILLRFEEDAYRDQDETLH